MPSDPASNSSKGSSLEIDSQREEKDACVSPRQENSNADDPASKQLKRFLTRHSQLARRERGLRGTMTVNR